MAKIKQQSPMLDPHLEKYYTEGNEKDRLSAHRLEKDRTLQILKKLLPAAPAVIFDVGGAAGVYAFPLTEPAAPAVIFDVGGAAGVYAFPLTEMGYEVHLIDPVAVHIDQAKQHAKNCKCHLASYTIGYARKIEREDRSADVVLMFGPLYHLIEKKDRNKALREAYRVLKPGGMLFAVGIARFASFMDAMHKGVVSPKFRVIEQDFMTGVHDKIIEGFTFAYLHHPSELKKEVQKSGFKNVTIRAIEGPVWEKRVMDTLSADEECWKKVLALLEKIETEETIIGASAHIMAVANK